MATKMHLMWFCAYSPHAGFGLDGWSGPRTGTGYDWTGPELWQDMAAVLERARFDLVMLGDSLAVPATYQGRMDAYLRYAEHTPFHDPGPLVAVMAAATRRIGLAATLSTTFYPPYLLARLMTTLDHLSRGRIAWNVVTSYKIEEALNFGYQELLDHDQRYDRADEYMALCYALWNSVGDGAILADKTSRQFADPSKVAVVRHQGEYFNSHTIGPVWPSPQGRPVLFQAGSSGRGQQFDPEVLDAFLDLTEPNRPVNQDSITLPTIDLMSGMVLATDLVSARGILMLTAGQQLTASLIQSIRSFEQREGSHLQLNIRPGWSANS